VVTVAIPYFISALAQLAYLVSGRRQVQGWQLTRDLSIAGAGALFATWVTFAAGYTAIYQALLAIFIGLAIYPFLKARRERLGQIPAPADIAVAAAGDGAASGAPTRHRHLRLHRGTVAPTGTGASENPQGQS
jgi:basic amino acid/polyamine antiporter, APA family